MAGTGVLEAFGLGLGIASLLTAFKGALDGYLLIESIFDKDNGLRDLILDYYIEREKLNSWGDRFHVNAASREDCLLNREPERIKRLLAEIFGRIKRCHEEAEGYLTIHQDSDHRVDYQNMLHATGDLNKHLQLDGPQVKAMSEAQMAKQQRKRVKWAIKNKEKFENVVKRLRKSNEDLLGLLTEPSLYAFVRALPAYVLANINSVFDLQQAQVMNGPENDLIRQAARLKILQSGPANSRDAELIDFQALHPAQARSTVQWSRHVHTYNNSIWAWIEWLDMGPTLMPAQKTESQNRIKTLSVMLRSAPESFDIARCIGYCNDFSKPHRIGLVFRIPQDLGMAVPMSLLDIIKRYKTEKTPPLGDRFRLAQRLATILMQLHASDWLHKAFRSDNILFFLGPAAYITKPYLAGFEYARDMSMRSIGTRPTGENGLDYYYHPEVANGFSKTLDLYSLGVVLLEIALWRPLVKPEDGASLDLHHKRFVAFATSNRDILDAAVGSTYAGVVRTCLQRSLPDPKFGAEFACAVNTQIVLPLERCSA